MLTESQFLEGAALGLGVEEEDAEELKGDPAAVGRQVLPIDGGERDRVDVVGEEEGDLSKDLLDTDTTGTLGVWEKLHEVG